MSFQALKTKYWDMYFQLAYVAQHQSVAKREQVGAVIVLPSGVIMPGYNGQPAGHHTNCCENTHVVQDGIQRMKTDDSVIHAEDNAIRKAIAEGIDLTGAHLFSTVSPCPKCCRQICDTAIEAVHYDRHHDDKSGLILLMNKDIAVHPR